MTINFKMDDVVSLEHRVRKLMDTKLARAINYDEDGVSGRMYVIARRMVLLKDSKNMTSEEKERVDRAISILEGASGLTQSRVSAATKEAESLTKDIFLRHRVPSDGNQYKMSKSRISKKFQSTMFMIRETCTTNDEMQIPDLGADERRKYLGDLTDSMISIANLMAKLKGKIDD